MKISELNAWLYKQYDNQSGTPLDAPGRVYIPNELIKFLETSIGYLGSDRDPDITLETYKVYVEVWAKGKEFDSSTPSADQMNAWIKAAATGASPKVVPRAPFTEEQIAAAPSNMKLSELKKQLERLDPEDKKNERIKILEEFIKARTPNDPKEDPGLSLYDYNNYATNEHKKPENFLVSENYLSSSFNGAEIFNDWIKKDGWIKQEPKPVIKAQLTPEQIAAPHKEKLSEWLASEKKKIETDYAEDAGWLSNSVFNKPADTERHKLEIATHFKETTDTRELVAKLTELTRLVKPKPTSESIPETSKRQKLEYEIEYITLLLGYKKAEKLTNDYAVMKAKHPECTIDMQEWKRHDASTNKHKFGGLNPDTPLTALHKSWLGKQKKIDLAVSQSINTFCINALDAAKVIPSNKVEVSSSPVSRAYETGIHSTVKPENISKFTLDRHFTETKKGFAIVRALTRSSAALNEKRGRLRATKAFEKAGFTPEQIDIKPDAFEKNSSNKNKQNKRIEEAAHLAIPGLPGGNPVSSESKIPVEGNRQAPATWGYQLAHGAENRNQLEMVKKLSKEKGAEFACSIPPGIIPEGNLEFGGSYQVLSARDATGKVVDVSFNGKYSRLGEERPAQLMTGKEFRKQTKAGKLAIRSDEIKEIETTLNALSAFVNHKKQKTSSFFTTRKKDKTQIQSQTDYDSKVDDLLTKVTAMLDTNPSLGKRKAGLEILQEQLTSVKQARPQLQSAIKSAATPAPEVVAERKSGPQP